MNQMNTVPIPQTVQTLQTPFKKITSLREGQAETIEMINNADTKFVIVSAPTGSGKTILGLMSCVNSSSSVYSVSTKMLQDQIQSDFSEVILLKGRSNYPCPRFSDYDLMADSCVKKGCEDMGGCPYELTKIKAGKAKYRVLNLSYLLYECNNSRGLFGDQDIIILDEADHIEQILIDYISLELGKKDKELLDRYGLNEPEYLTKPESWKPWAAKVKGRLAQDLKLLEGQAESTPIEEVIKKLRQVKRLINKMDILYSYSNSNWIRYEINDKTIYKPIWLTPALSEQFLFRHAAKWVLMSATFPEYLTYCKLLGIDHVNSTYISLPSNFPVKNRLVKFLDTADMGYNKGGEGAVMLEIKRILNQHNTDKGIIHAVSYRLRDQIMRIGDKRLVTHETGNKEDVINRFKQSDRPLVLVSPSIERGVSLDDDACRFVIIPKVPYQSTQDRVVSARLYSGKFGQTWYQADAAQRICQMAGRGVRSMEDYCMTYILDSQFHKLARRPSLFPDFFNEALEL